MLLALVGNTRQRKLASAWGRITACRVKLVSLRTVTPTSSTSVHRLGRNATPYGGDMAAPAEDLEHKSCFRKVGWGL